MKSVVAAVVAVVGIWAGAAVAEAHRQAAPETCGIRHGTVEYASRNVRVVQRQEPVSDKYAPDYELWYACIRRRPDASRKHLHGYRHRRRLLEKSCDFECAGLDVEIFDNDDADDPRQRLVFSYILCGGVGGGLGPRVEQCAVDISVLALRTGRRAHQHAHVRAGDLYRVFDPVLAPSGTAAWIEPVVAPKTADQVTGLTLSGDTPLFDEGGENTLSDLAVTGQTLYWKHGGAPRSAQVP
jgi:hypothetical protein